MRIVEIQELVCQAYDVRLVDMLSGRRGRRLIEPRWVAMWLARETTLHSLPVIGRHFGGRDHTTVMHAVAQIDARRHEDQAFAVRLGALRHAVDRANGLVSDELPAPRKLSPAAIYALASAKAYLAREIAAARAEMRGAA